MYNFSIEGSENMELEQRFALAKRVVFQQVSESKKLKLIIKQQKTIKDSQLNTFTDLTNQSDSDEIEKLIDESILSRGIPNFSNECGIIKEQYSQEDSIQPSSNLIIEEGQLQPQIEADVAQAIVAPQLNVNSCGCKPHVLCVDDNDFNLYPITEMIKKLYNIVPDEAYDGQMAVNLYKERF